MTKGREKDVASVDGMLEPDVLVEKIQEGIDKKKFLILPHPEVQNYIDKNTNITREYLNEASLNSNPINITKKIRILAKRHAFTKDHKSSIEKYFHGLL